MRHMSCAISFIGAAIVAGVLFIPLHCTLVCNIQSPSIALKNPSPPPPPPPSHPPSPPLPLLRFVFAHNCHESGLISDTEWSIYCDWHSFLLDTLSLKFDGIVYLKTDPKVGRRCGRRRGIEEREGTEKRGE